MSLGQSTTCLKHFRAQEEPLSHIIHTLNTDDLAGKQGHGIYGSSAQSNPIPTANLPRSFQHQGSLIQPRLG
jgi:hypothetical protein